MAYTTIDKSTDHFNTLIYTGNNTDDRAITGLGFRPDLCWFKLRNTSQQHELYDIVRGANQTIEPDSTAAQVTNTNRLKSFDSDGFTLGTSTAVNKAYNYVAWNWKTQNAQGSANTDGSINTTYTSVNTTAGISISTYAGNGASSGTATIGHGLGAVPQVVIAKKTSGTQNWHMYHAGAGNGSALILNDDQVRNTQTDYWGDTTPTSTLVTVGPNNLASGTHALYCFAEKKGYSKFGIYNGNANSTTPPFVYTGFKPAFVICKISTTGGSDSGGWVMYDNKRYPVNLSNSPVLFANITNAESDAYNFEMFSNGFRFNSTSVTVNGSGNTYAYLAFAEAPLVGSNNMPANAR